jgi:uncharacterized membrane protein YhhN
MLNIYFYIAFILFIINGIAYNILLFSKKEEPTTPKLLRVIFMFMVVSLFWPVELFYLSKLTYEECKNGQGGR